MARKGETKLDLQRKLETSDKQIAALKDAVLKLRASSSEVQKQSIQQQRQHEEDMEALRQGQKREAELLRRCEAAELRLAESEESCKRAEAVAQELRSREQQGNDLVPTDLVSGIQSLKAKLGPQNGIRNDSSQKMQQKNEDVVNSAVLFCEGAVNLLKAALSPRHHPQKRQKLNDQGPLGKVSGLITNIAKQSQFAPGLSSKSTSSEEKAISTAADSHKVSLDDIVESWMNELCTDSCSMAKIKAISEAMLADLECHKLLACQTLAVHIVCAFMDCCKQPWEESGLDTSSSLVSAPVRLEDMKGGRIEDILLSSTWMQDSKRCKNVFTNMLLSLQCLHTDIAALCGDDLLLSVESELKTELLIRRNNQHTAVEIGLSTALAAIMRLQNHIQEVRVVLIDLIAAEDPKACLPQITAILCTWPSILLCQEDRISSLILTLLRELCESALIDSESNQDDTATQAGSMQSAASGQGKSDSYRAAQILEELGKSKFGWHIPKDDETSMPKEVIDHSQARGVYKDCDCWVLLRDLIPRNNAMSLQDLVVSLQLISSLKGLPKVVSEISEQLCKPGAVCQTDFSDNVRQMKTTLSEILKLTGARLTKELHHEVETMINHLGSHESI